MEGVGHGVAEAWGGGGGGGKGPKAVEEGRKRRREWQHGLTVCSEIIQRRKD